MSSNRIRSFSDFWPSYVRQHSRYRTRLLHAVGSVAALALVVLALSVHGAILFLAPIVAYGFGWYSHSFVEGNGSATFVQPLYSLLADYRMLFLMMAGKMEDEVDKHARGVSSTAVQKSIPPPHVSSS